MTIHHSSKRRPILSVMVLVALGLTACNGPGSDLASNLLKNGKLGPVPTDSPTPAPSSPPTTSLYDGPADVAKYVQKFVDDGKIQGVDVVPSMDGPKLTIRISSLDSVGSSVIGLCETGNNLRRVTFDPDFWNSVDETQRELLTHHELGHCVLSRAHDNSLLSSGEYASIMYPILLANTPYLNNQSYYLGELFSQAALSPEASTLAANEATKTDLKHICTRDQVLGQGAASGAGGL